VCKGDEKMIYSRTLFSVLGILLALGGSPTHAKIPNFSMLELAEKSDVVFSGKVTAVGEDRATVLVAEILSGKLDEALVSLSPINIQHCVGGSINFIVDEKVLVFGKKSSGNRVIVTAGGQGKLRIDPERDERTMRAAKQILAIVPLKEDQKNRAMLALVKDDNETLRSESHRYIVTRISHSKLANQYKQTLISFIHDREAEIQRTGLQAMQFVQAQDAIPRIVELTRSENLGVVSAASMALGQYDTEESVAALIALTKHANPEVRHYSKGDARAKEVIDNDIELVIAALKSGGVNDSFGPSFHAVGILGLSGKPEAKEALKWAAQSHPNDGIRAYAERSLADSTNTHQ
jgi:hypothetical protein